MYLADQRGRTAVDDELACNVDTFIKLLFSVHTCIPRGIILLVRRGKGKVSANHSSRFIVLVSPCPVGTRRCRAPVHCFLGRERLLQERGRESIAYTPIPICATNMVMVGVG
jgi:hypothetical protein